MRVSSNTWLFSHFCVKMCGRCASSRSPEKIRHACAYRPRGRGGKEVVKPPWVSCSNMKYYPCYNFSPQMNAPVIISSSHPHISQAMEGLPFPDLPLECCERVLQPMKWGLVPSWRKAGQSKTPLLNNCRLEGILEKPSFRSAVERRRRCVVVADGFFEWDRQGKKKQPYFIHFRDNRPTADMGSLGEVKEEAEEEDASLCDAKVDENVLNGRMLTMAGLFDIWAAEGVEDEPLYSYTVITVDAHANFASIHDRMPAVLDGDEAVRAWLDPDVATQEAVKSLRPSSSLTWYPVSEVVNNVKNKTPECILKIDPRKQVSSKQKTLLSWFPKHGEQTTPSEKKGQESIAKRPKVE